MNGWIRRFFLVFITNLVLAACVGSATKQVPSEVLTSRYWGPWQSTPFDERIAPASDALVNFIRQENIKYSIPHNPSRPSFDAALWKDVHEAVSTMPALVKKHMSKKLAAIVLIENLGSTGFSDIIRDERGHAAAGFVILDVKAIDRKANDWATWKENSPFAQDGNIVIKALIEADDHNKRIATIQYILLHEFGHILAIGEDFHPPWDAPQKTADALQQYPFAAVSWKINAQTFQYEPLIAQDGFDCAPVHYYSEQPKLPTSKAESCYRALEQTAFVSLYASTNPFDDFAETFAFYVHRILLKKPWSMEIGNSTQVYRYEPDWADKRFDRKRTIIESILTGNSLLRSAAEDQPTLNSRQ